MHDGVRVWTDHGHVIVESTDDGWWVCFEPEQARKLSDSLIAASFEAGSSRRRPEGDACGAPGRRPPDAASDGGRA